MDDRYIAGNYVLESANRFFWGAYITKNYNTFGGTVWKKAVNVMFL